MTRCTCLYRPSTTGERERGRAVITVLAADPFCPAGDRHVERERRDTSTVRER